MELNDARGDYSSPDSEPGRSLRNRYYISKKKMAFLVVVFVCLIILSAVIGTVVSNRNKSRDMEGINSPITNRSRKKADETTPKPSENGPWKNFRLPKNLKPLHYDVTIRVNMSDSVFHGLVNIRFTVVQATKYVILHVDPNRMRYIRLIIKDMRNRLVERKKTAKHYKSYLVVEVDQELKRGLWYTISIQYYSDFKNYPRKGLYWLRNRRVFNPATQEYEARKKMAVTFFAPISARRNFPCFDEPELKATFSLMLIYNRGYTSLSNMPLITRRMTNSLVFDRFQTSFLMPTYMLNYIIFDYSSTGTTTANGTKLRLWSPRHTFSQRSYALRVANLTLPYYEALFAARYPISKLDMITVPSYPVAAMETWGLINYVQSRLLLQDDGSQSSLSMKKQEIALLVAHEIAHQWFGNLATARWWNDLVIHEGCATYLQYFGADYVEPSLELMDQFYNIEVRAAMMEDSKNSSKEISQSVLTSKDIGANIHLLMYRKGAAVLRMLHKYIGDKAFFEGLKLYVRRFAYRSAGQDDLWHAISETSRLDVGEIMRTWTKQPGFPIITVRRVGSEEIVISQKRFLSGQANTGYIDSTNWKAPITYVTSRDPKRKELLLLTTRSKQIVIQNNYWIKLNTNADGYFIVNYDAKNWNRLSQQLKADHSVFSVLDRSSLIKDAFTLAEEGVLPYEVAFNMTLYLRKEADWIPWQYVKLFVSSMIMRLPTKSKTRKLLLEYYGNITRPLLEKYGWNEIKNSNLKERFLQETAVTAALNAGDEQAMDMAKRLFRNWMANQTRIQPNVAKVVFFYGVMNGGKEEWDRVYTVFTYERRKAERDVYMNALGASTDSWTLNRFLQMAMYSRYIYMKQALQIVADSSTNGRYTAWNFLKENWDSLPGSNNVNYAIDVYIKPVAEKFANAYNYNDVYDFFKKKFGRSVGTTKAEELFETMRMNVAWAKRGVPQIKTWMEKYSRRH